MNVPKIRNTVAALALTFFCAGIVSSIFIAPIPYFRDGNSSSLGLIEMVAYLVCSLSVYSLLFIVLKAAWRFHDSTLFKERIVSSCALGGKILLCGSAVFGLFFLVALFINAGHAHLFEPNTAFGTVVLTLGFEFICILVALIGVAISAALIVYAKTIRAGKEYKEDSEAIV